MIFVRNIPIEEIANENYAIEYDTIEEIGDEPINERKTGSTQTSEFVCKRCIDRDIEMYKAQDKIKLLEKKIRKQTETSETLRNKLDETQKELNIVKNNNENLCGQLEVIKTRYLFKYVHLITFLFHRTPI